MSNWTVEEKKACRDAVSRMRLCGCGLGTTWAIVQMLLERGADPAAHGTFYDPADGVTAEWVQFGAHVLDGYDLLDHGIGIGCAWITDDGKLVLRLLQEHGIDDSDWPIWVQTWQISDSKRTWDPAEEPEEKSSNG